MENPNLKWMYIISNHISSLSGYGDIYPLNLILGNWSPKSTQIPSRQPRSVGTRELKTVNIHVGIKFQG